MRRHYLVLAAVLSCAYAGGSNAPSAAQPESVTAGASVSADARLRTLAIAGGTAHSALDSRLARVHGPVDVWVSLSDPALAAYKSARLEQIAVATETRAAAATSRVRVPSTAAKALDGELRSHRDTLRGRQDSLVTTLHGFGAQELGRVHVAHNAVAVRVDAASLPTIAQLPGVAKVRPVIHYERALGETVPYVGATAAHTAGKDGTGVRVAVLDSGIDYTHRNFGGPGTAAAYAAAFGANPADPKNTTRDGLFPTAKVVDGFDFVGDLWPTNGPRTEDPDPIDFQGHGTHVADIIAGRSIDGTHKGVAPGASLVALKVCSSVTTSCNGVALLKAMDFALDPNGDGDISDAVDVINMSLGSNYGQDEDDLSQASAVAVKLGVVVVAAAGNAANRPYIVSSPSTGRGVISVAQTAVPSDKAFPLVVNSPAAIAGSYANTATVDWAPVGAGFNGDVARVGRGCPASGATPEDPYLTSPAGKVALIDRGACAVSLKVDRAARAGAIGVLIGLVAAGDAITFSFGGGTTFVPTMVIQLSLSNAIKANLPVNVTLSNANSIALVGSMAGSSSRGPTMSDSSIKPEIGAPGASVSAIAGSGNGQNAFGGTSGATPMVAGAAALLIQAFPKRSPEQIKALLMNSAETQVFTNAALLPGRLAPITRIGAGELRVNRALALGSAAREPKDKSAALSFGFQDVDGTKSLEKSLLIENFGNTDKLFTVTPSFRYASDEASGAVRVMAPRTVSVGADSKEKIDVTLFIDGSKLPDWTLDGGPNGGNGALLDGPEFDGFITLTSGGEKLSVPWHVLPRKSADLSVNDTSLKVGQALTVRNKGVAVGEFDVFSLTGVSRRAHNSVLPQPGDNFAFIDLRAVGVRLAAPGFLQFAVNTFGRRSHPNYPAEFDVEIDVNRDGTPDFVVFNAENGGFGATGQNVVVVLNLTTGVARVFFFIDADLNSANAILTVPTTALGITDATTFDFTVTAFDNYFTGVATDGFGKMTYTPSTPRFVATGVPAAGVAPKSSARLGTAAVAGGDVASPSQQGLLLMYRLDSGREADIVRVR